MKTVAISSAPISINKIIKIAITYSHQSIFLLSLKSRKGNNAFLSDFLIFNIPFHDAIGSSKNIGSLAVNNLSVPGLLISSSRFSDPSLIEDLDNLNIKTEVSPVSQFQLSGGSIHCLTNEL